MRKRIRLTAFIVWGLFLLTACAAPAKEPADLNGFLVKEGVTLTRTMDALAQSKQYVSLMATSESLRPIIAEVAAADYGTPENAYLIPLTDDALLQAINAIVGDAQIPSDVLHVLKYKINASVFANILNGSYGSETVTAMSILTWGKSYIQPAGWSENTLLILEYSGSFSSMVSFVQSGEGIISASSIFVKNGEKDIRALLEEYLGDTGLTYEQYAAGQLQGLLNG